MKISSDFSDLLFLLNEEKVEYLLVGGYAVSIHSEPRYTKDIDIWVRPSPENAKKIYSALTKFGAPLKSLNIEESDFTNEDCFVQFGREPVRVDFLMSLKGLNFDEAWSRKEIINLGGLKVNLIGKNDLIVSKKLVGRPQDLIDVESLKK